MLFLFVDNLTVASDNDILATQLIKYLLQTVGHDVCTSKSNSLSLYQLIHNASRVYRAINTLISRVDQETNNVWDQYDQYTSAIDSLELQSSSPFVCLSCAHMKKIYH
jgi:flagellar capping protein FliD